MKNVVRLLFTLTLIFTPFYSLNSYANELIIAPINDPALKNLLIRTMFVDDKKRVYLGTDSGLYRYANSNLVKLDNNFAISAKAFNGAISNIQALDDRYLAISAFLSDVIYFDRVNDGYVKAPYGINQKNSDLTSERTSNFNWLWKTTNELISYSSIEQQYKTLLSTPDTERILNFKFNRQNNSLYVMTKKGLYYSSHIESPVKLIYEVGQEYFSGASLINNTLHFLSEKSHLTFKKGKLTSQTTMHFCPKEQQTKLLQKKYEYTHKRPYFYDFIDGSLMIISECGVYQYHIEKNQLISLILPPANNTRQWLKGTSYTKDLPIILETSSGLFLIDKDKNISPLRDKASASMGGATFSVIKVNKDQYLIADGTPGLKISSSRLHQFGNLEKSDLERMTGGHSLRDIIKIDNDTLWLGSQTNGLFKVVKQHGVWTKQKIFLASSHIRSLYIDNNSLWVATEGSGLHLIDLRNDVIIEIPSPNDRQGLLSFLPLISGKLLIGTTNGVLIFDKAERKQVGAIPYVQGAVWGMAQTSKGDIWLGTHWPTTGLFKFDNNLNVLETYTYENDLHQSAIMDIELDEFEQPIIATWGGGLLFRKHNEQQFSQLTTENGLLNDTVQSVIKLTNNEYWLSTEKGLAKVNLCQFDNCKHQVKTFTINDGLSTNLFDLNSAHLNEDGTLIYGGFFGLTWFDPKSDIVENNVIPAEHYVNRLIVDGTNITNKIITNKNNLQQLNLNYDIQNINITFNSDDYINQSNKKYRYKINGSDWSLIQKPVISLSALTHGQYLIEAGSSNSDGLWAKNNLKLLIVITPPIWLSFYAKTTYLIVFIFSVFIFIKLRNKNLLKQNQLLETKIKEKTILLSEAIAEKEHLFESSSHELQTPLTLILNYLDLLPKGEFSAKHDDYISIVKTQSKRLRYLVKNMLLNADTTLPIGKSLLINIVPSIESLIGYHKAQADKSNISIKFEDLIIENVFVNLVVDSDQIMFGNLIDNAIKYSPNNSSISIELSQNTSDFTFCISDQGPGFKDVSKIGNKFYREFEQIQGTGLGLSNVINCVNNNKGNISFTNKNGGGSKIVVTLPISDNTPTTMCLESQILKQDYSDIDFTYGSTRKISSCRMLLVEDDTNLTLLFKETIALQFDIHFCSNGKEAMEYLKETKDELPEIIISDVMMPLMNGYELCERVKKSDELKHIPFLLLTAKSDSLSQQKGLSLGADDYINKPFKMVNLQLKINNIIKTNNARKQLQLSFITAENHIEISGTNQHEFITQVRESLKINLSQSNYNISDLAGTQHMSNSTLRRKLKQFFDQTFTDILKKARINKAKELLATDAQIQLIVERCGYTSHSYFNKHFKEELGVSPKEFRANLIKKCAVLN
jgi:signal transduction histidine kinase/response regulator RpfG family c-di-GMP phosphodiesterase/ligand-binding sensor domain-containing protein